MKNALQVIASLVAKKGHADEVRDLLMPAIKNFRAEPGCMGYLLMEDKKQIGRFVTFETWKDEAALNVHMHSPTMENLNPLLKKLLDSEIKQEFLKILAQ